MDAIQMLKDDHQKVKELFRAFEQQPGDSEKRHIVETALRELDIHAKLEEDIFYPAARAATEETELMDEAVEEHHVAKQLMAELKHMKPGDSRYDAKFTVLAEMVKHHIEEEENEMLPRASRANLDLVRLGEQMAQRKIALQRGPSARKGRARAHHNGGPKISVRTRRGRRAALAGASRH
jgi:hypothetical protein